MKHTQEMDENSYPSIKQAIGLLLFYFISTFIFCLFTPRLIGELLGSVATLLFAYLMQRTIGDKLEIGLRQVRNWKIYLYSFFCSASMLWTFVCSFMWMIVLTQLDTLSTSSTLYDGRNLITMAITIVLIAPITEEILFRGIILKSFLQRYPPTKAILISSIIFAFAHMQPIKLGNTMLMGYLTGWLYYRTKSIIPGIICHMTNNAIVLIPIFNFIHLPSLEKIFSRETTLTNTHFILAILGGVILFVIFFIPLKKIIDKSFPTNSTDKQEELN